LKSALYNFLFLNKFLLLGQRRSLRELTYFTFNKKRLTMLAVLVRNKGAIQLRYDESLTPCFMAIHAIGVVGRPQQVFTDASLACDEVAVGKFTGDRGLSAFVEGVTTSRAFGSHI
jgi:hypothetical protein